MPTWASSRVSPSPITVSSSDSDAALGSATPAAVEELVVVDELGSLIEDSEFSILEDCLRFSDMAGGLSYVLSYLLVYHQQLHDQIEKNIMVQGKSYGTTLKILRVVP